MDLFFNFSQVKQSLNKEKIKLTENDVTIQFVLSRPTSTGYKIRFLVSINPVQKNLYSLPIRASQIDMVSLHDAILLKIDKSDRKYVTLQSFDTMKCEFNFNFNTWLKDALSGVSPKTYFSKFDQEYKLKIMPPKMLFFDTMRSMFFDYIVKEFKNYIVKNNYEKKWLGSLLPSSFHKKLNIRLINMFDFEYDYMNNSFITRLKSQYVLGASMIVGLAFKELKKQTFKDRMEGTIKNTEKVNWKEITKKKFI